jgi:uncharacterized protein (DUF433 family)
MPRKRSTIRGITSAEYDGVDLEELRFYVRYWTGRSTKYDWTKDPKVQGMTDEEAKAFAAATAAKDQAEIDARLARRGADSTDIAHEAAAENKQAVSFRFDRVVAERLRGHAQAIGMTQGALVERYVDEGVRMDEHPGIYFRDAGSGRRPALLGTRLDVAQVVETLRQNENSVEQTADYLDTPPAQVEIALRYYADFPAEIDDWTRESRAIAERERELWRRRERLLAGG